MINIEVYRNDTGDRWICKIEYMDGEARCSRSCEADTVAKAMADIAEFIEYKNMR